MVTCSFAQVVEAGSSRRVHQHAGQERSRNMCGQNVRMVQQVSKTVISVLKAMHVSFLFKCVLNVKATFRCNIFGTVFFPKLENRKKLNAGKPQEIRPEGLINLRIARSCRLFQPCSIGSFVLQSVIHTPKANVMVSLRQIQVQNIRSGHGNASFSV